VSEPKPFNTLYPGFYQTAYVTNDLKEAQKRTGAAYGITDWLMMSDLAFEVKQGPLTIDVALANVGDSQIELIQPKGGNDAMYRDYLAGGGDFRLAFHHLCKGFETEEQFFGNLAELRRLGIPIPMNNSEPRKSDIALACYGDFRASIGHYLEYVWFTETGRKLMASVPRHG
jgi:hypothetical protein